MIYTKTFFGFFHFCSQESSGKWDIPVAPVGNRAQGSTQDEYLDLPGRLDSQSRPIVRSPPSGRPVSCLHLCHRWCPRGVDPCPTGGVPGGSRHSLTGRYLQDRGVSPGVVVSGRSPCGPGRDKSRRGTQRTRLRHTRRRRKGPPPASHPSRQCSDGQQNHQTQDKPTAVTSSLVVCVTQKVRGL